MLSFRRKLGESFFIVEDGRVVAEVTFDEIKNGKVKFGVKAEQKTKIYRAEIWERIKREKGAC